LPNNTEGIFKRSLRNGLLSKYEPQYRIQPHDLRIVQITARVHSSEGYSDLSLLPCVEPLCGNGEGAGFVPGKAEPEPQKQFEAALAEHRLKN